MKNEISLTLLSVLYTFTVYNNMQRNTMPLANTFNEHTDELAALRAELQIAKD